MEKTMILMRKHILYGFLAITLTTLLALFATGRNDVDAAEKNSKLNDTQAVSREALTKFNSLIGGWRGVGMPKRFSNSGAWREDAEFVWDFKGNTVAIRYEITDGKLFKSARLTYDPKKKNYRLHVVTSDDKKREYIGKLTEDRLILESIPDKDELVYRMTLRRLNEKRTMVLHERRRASSKFYTRVAEVGYTREGTRLANSDSTEPVCVVTGGVGTSKVSFKGKTYWVCCSGCLQAFNEDPAGVITDYKARIEQEKKDRVKELEEAKKKKRGRATESKS